MERSEHFTVSAGKCFNGHKYVISGVDSDNCLDAKAIVCEYSDLMIGSSHIFVNQGDGCRSYWVEDSYVFNCSDEPVSFLANWEIGTYGFAKDKFPFIVPFHKFNPDNIGESLQHNVVKQQ